MSDQHRRYFDRLAATVVLRQVIVLAEQSVGLTDAAGAAGGAGRVGAVTVRAQRLRNVSGPRNMPVVGATGNGTDWLGTACW